MAYTNRWSITFKDFDDTTHTIYIQQDGWTGGVTALTPGNNPMVWDENSSEDLTERVRGKTGRIEVIEENYGEKEQGDENDGEIGDGALRGELLQITAGQYL